MQVGLEPSIPFLVTAFELLVHAVPGDKPDLDMSAALFMSRDPESIYWHPGLPALLLN